MNYQNNQLKLLTAFENLDESSLINMQKLEKITFNSNVTTIPDECFYNLYNLILYYCKIVFQTIFKLYQPFI